MVLPNSARSGVGAVDVAMGPLSFNGSMLVVSDCFFFGFFPPPSFSLSRGREGERKEEEEKSLSQSIGRYTHIYMTRKEGKGRDGERPVRTAIVGWR